jgi:Leucine-rich repeat (LRR) protein
MDLIALLRRSDCIITDSIDSNEIDWNDSQVRVVYDKPYDKDWTDEELCTNITQLRCAHNRLTSLPALPLCTKLYCYDNKLTSLHPLPVCTILYCYGNQLTSLPTLPLCTHLWCFGNQLTSLPALPLCTNLICHSNQLTNLPILPLCTKLDCSYNQLTSLPDLPLCTWLYCHHNRLTSLPPLPLCVTMLCRTNLLPFYDLTSWHRVWRVKDMLLARKYFTKWRLFIFASRKRDLHNELKYSPELPFYKDALAALGKN